MGTLGTIGTIVIGVIAFIIIVAIVVFLVTLFAPVLIGLIILAIIIGVGYWIYGRIKGSSYLTMESNSSRSQISFSEYGLSRLVCLFLILINEGVFHSDSAISLLSCSSL